MIICVCIFFAFFFFGVFDTYSLCIINGTRVKGYLAVKRPKLKVELKLYFTRIIKHFPVTNFIKFIGLPFKPQPWKITSVRISFDNAQTYISENFAVLNMLIFRSSVYLWTK